MFLTYRFSFAFCLGGFAMGLIVWFIMTFYTQITCQNKTIVEKRQAVYKYFYTFLDGSTVWSDKNFSLGDNVCVRK